MNKQDLESNLNDAGILLRDFARNEANEAAELMALSFEVAGKRISNSLASAAKSGELSVKGLAQAILRDLSNVGINKFITKPIDNLMDTLLKSIPIFGARASGGQVNTGGAYLVGENGPELFVPRSGGSIENQFASAPINIHINMANNSQLSDVKRSTAQISAALARAVQSGVKRI